MTPKEQECLDAIVRLTVRNVPPSYDELCAELSLKSKSGVARLIDALEIEGFVTRDPKRVRSLKVVPELKRVLRELVTAHGYAAVQAELQRLQRRAA